MTWQARIQSALEERRARDAFRVRRVVENGAGRFLTHARRQYCNFSSNDYLGLSQHPAIVRAWQQGAEHYGVGSGGRGTSAAIPQRIRGWKRRLPTGWAIRARCCSSPALPPIRR